MDIIEISPSERSKLTTLFTNHKHLRISVDAVLQGYCGTAVANAGSDVRVAQLSIGPFRILGGDPTHPVARNLVEQLPNVMVVAEDGWRETVLQAHGERIRIQRRLSFSSENLNLERLRTLMSDIPDRFRVERIDIGLAQRIDAEVSPHLILPEVFKSPADFVERGIGFCAIAGERIVCGATSAIICDGAIEIQINTNELFRRMGIATTVGATLIAHCLEHGIDPHWDTSNPVSEKLAKKLGFIPDSTYEWLEII